MFTRTRRHRLKKALLILIIISAVFGIKHLAELSGFPQFPPRDASSAAYIGDIPEYQGEAYVEINNNIPTFTESDRQTLSAPGYEYYSALDALGRCGKAECCAGKETMPEADEMRGEIYMIHPSGWNNEYGFEERCHLIAWCISAENANDHNLITGTHDMNQTMLRFETEIARYIDKTGNHVMYRVVPAFYENEIVARGVYMSAESVEDGGTGVSFKVFCFNHEDGYEIDYSTGQIAISD